ncbi:MAG TPA: hypothetical protein VFQ61_26780 [Polyangiaceae bacterium]|nr:hypothetical protein [Polyangiaceae bacterium]
MKALHRPDLYAWSRFDEARNMDFNSWLWVRPQGNVVIDPLPLTPHEQSRLEQLGGVRYVVVTNSDHVRDAQNLAAWAGAQISGPAAERASFPLTCQRWLADEEEVVPGLRTLELNGSKTPGELALVLEDTTLITGDLVRAPRAGALDCLPDSKLANRAEAVRSLQRLAALGRVETVLTGDGWPVFRFGAQALRELAARMSSASEKQ